MLLFPDSFQPQFDLNQRTLTAVFTLQTVQPHHQLLNNGLTLKSVTDENDAERLIEFNGQIFGAHEAAMTRSLIYHHPASRPDYWLYIEDGGQILSSLVLIPWEWRYDDVTLKSGEMGIVGTHEAYRNRGLIRTLDRRFKELLCADGFHLSHIQGIPYFYRQFGYEYTLPLENQWRIELRHINTSPDPAVSFRLATVEDIPALMQFYEAAAQPLNISALRSAHVWRYLLEHTNGTATEAQTWLLEVDGQSVAYCRIPRYGFGEGLIVSEASRLDLNLANTLLGWLKNMAMERDKPYIRFNLSTEKDLLRIARSYGAYDAGGYQWQIHVVDAAALLRRLAPVLERRLSASPFANLNQQVAINLYRGGVELDFVQGKLRAVNTVAKVGHSEIRIPPNLLAPLVLGWRSRSELAACYPDFGIYGSSGVLVDVLFPKMQAFIDTNY
jgi:predicted N-acetyltransferase YhbS